MKNVIFRTHVTGLSHHQYLFCVGELQVGTALRLERDPENRYDLDKAIRIMLGNHQIGWVPKQEGVNTAQAIIARLMDAGVNLTCTVAIHDQNHPDVQYRLHVDIAVNLSTKAATSFINNPDVNMIRPGTGLYRYIQKLEETAFEMGKKTQRVECDACMEKSVAEAFAAGSKQGYSLGRGEVTKDYTAAIDAAFANGRKEGLEAGKALHLMHTFGPTTEFASVILPTSVFDAIKAKGVEEEGASIANTAYNKGYAKRAVDGGKEIHHLIEALLNGKISFFDLASSHLGISRSEVQRRWDRAVLGRKDQPCEDMVVRVVRPEYYKTMSTLQLELRSAVEGSASSPVIPSLKVRPGDTVRISILKREK